MIIDGTLIKDWYNSSVSNYALFISYSVAFLHWLQAEWHTCIKFIFTVFVLMMYLLITFNTETPSQLH